MNRPFSNLATGAFTRIELALITLVLVLLSLLLIPGIKAEKRRALRERCRDNLKQIGIAYRTWSTDASDTYPQHIEVESGGSKEWLTAGQLFLHFRGMSNELCKPKILICPADKGRCAAESFGEGFSNTNISYFTSLDAASAYPQTFLSGDRNLALADRAVVPGMIVITTNPATRLAWTEAIHGSCGNVGLCDGSVQWFDQNGLAAGVRGQEIANNRIVLP